MFKKEDPWYIHAVLIVVILVLFYFLIRVAIIDPTDIVETNRAYTLESQRRMDNLRQAQILWQKKYGSYTDNLDSLINYIKVDPDVQKLMVTVDSLTGKSRNPFVKLTNGVFEPESLYHSPRTLTRYILKIDVNEVADTIVDAKGKIKDIKNTVVKGKLYYIECPDGYGTIGDIEKSTMLNASSWN